MLISVGLKDIKSVKVISEAGAVGKWIQSAIFKDLYYFSDGLNSLGDIKSLTANDVPLVKKVIAVGAGYAGTEVDSGLVDNDFALAPNEASFVSLTKSSVDNWILAGDTENVYYYNNADRADGIKIKTKPKDVIVGNKFYNEAVGATKDTLGANQWCCAKMPDGDVDTIYIYADGDLDLKSEGFVKANIDAKDTIYAKVDDIANKTIATTGATLELMKAEEGKRFCNTGMSFHNNSNSTAMVKVFHKFAKDSSVIDRYSITLGANQTADIIFPEVLNPNDILLVSADIAGVSAILNGDYSDLK